MPADGTPLVSFGDFITATKPKSIVSPSDIFNDTAANAYLFADLMKGSSENEVIQNGASIKIPTRLDKHTAAGFYLPNQTLTPRGMNVTSMLTANWRFHQGNFAWTEEEVNLNGQNSADNYVYLAKIKRDAYKQDAFESIDNTLWATPSSADMETSTGLQPFSVLTFITTDGLAPSGFTTVQGIDPSVKSKWRNQFKSYTAASQKTTLFPAFDVLWANLKWKKPKGQAWTKDSMPGPTTRILTDVNGLTNYQKLVRADGDRTVPLMNDAGTLVSGPQYMGIEIERINGIDALADTNPRYFWIDSRYLHPVFHSQMYFDERDPQNGGIQQPTTWAVFCFTYYNLICKSRNHLGVIFGV